MKRALWGIIFVAGLYAASANARSVAVRSGEHNSFTRVVVLFPQGTDWNARQDANSITLSATGGPWEYDLSTAFRLIPRSRILSMDALPDGRGLRIITNGTVSMTSFNLSRGGAVIDVSDNTTPRASTQIDLPPYWRAPIEIPVPSERIQQAERELLAQLGRAASQGAVQVNPMRTRIPASDVPNATDTAAELTSHLALWAQTVVDRDMDIISPSRLLTPQGNECAPDQDFDPAAWLDTLPLVSQLSKARQNLVGEFDRPNREQVTHLTQVYVALGLGTEAHSVMAAFGQKTQSDRALFYMAAIEKNMPATDSSYSAMAGCSGRVALWALLGASETLAADQVDFNAVQASFSSLPSPLRDLLGPRLIEILLRYGAQDTAEAVRNTFRRSDSADRISAQLIEGELDLARQDLRTADTHLTAISEGKDGRAARALALRIDAMIERGQAVSIEETQRAADFGRLLGPTEDGLLMRRAESLGAASVGDFDRAFAVLADLSDQTAMQIRHQTLVDVFKLLISVPDDTLFLSRYLPRQEEARGLSLPLDQQVKLSRRLSELGFGPEAARILTDQAKATMAGKVAMAQAALTTGDTASAVTQLAGVTDSTAMAPRAEALSNLGEHAAAARLYAEIGNTERAAQEAWRSGSWAAIAEFGTEAQKMAIQRAGIAPPPPSNTPPAGPLTRATNQIAYSQADRAAFQALLQQTSAP